MKSKYKKGDLVYVNSNSEPYIAKYVRTNKLGNIILSDKNEYVYDNETKQYYCKYFKQQKIITKKEYDKLIKQCNKELKKLTKLIIHNQLVSLFKYKQDNFTENEKVELKQFVMNIVDKFLSKR